MSNPILLPCDGCGQLADSAHISRRLQRLAWATRFRPLHIQALLLAGIAPKHDSNFLYAPGSSFHGEARKILKAVQLSAEGKSAENILTEFQKLGLMLIHVLECPLEDGVSLSQAHDLFKKQLPATLARIRRSLKPKRVLLISGDLHHLDGQLHRTDLGCPILPSPAGAFLASSHPTESEFEAFRAALAGSNAHSV